MSQPKQLVLGAQIHGVGHGWGEWRHPDALPNASTNLDFYIRQAEWAEHAKLDFVFVADSLYIHENSSPHYLNRFEPLTILSALSMRTQHIGLVATVTVSYSEPFNVARQLASLDQLSGGRAGWNVVTSWLAGTSDNFNRGSHPAHSERYRIAQEYLDVTKGLWDSWEDDAFAYDKASGEFFDRQKLHTLDHKGEFFTVKGPLNIARSRQGQPVIFQAGSSESGRNFAARNAEAIFVHHDSFEQAQDYYRDIKARAASFGRDPDSISILPGMRPIIGRDEADVEDRYQQATTLVSIEDAIVLLGRPFNDHNFKQYPLDEPFPNVGDLGQESQRDWSDRIKKTARERGFTLRETALHFAKPQRTFTGTGEQLADTMEYWLRNGACDGFILNPPLPDGLQSFAEHVAPVLQARQLLRTEYQHSTLRGHLGLNKPVNRYSSPQSDNQE